MGKPATTGIQRTKISDMEIGDYIAVQINGSSMGLANYLTNFGNATGTELPLAGGSDNASATGLVYFVKCKKGLLICDRVVRNKISWDVLNGSKLIQGLPWDDGVEEPGLIRSLTGGITYAALKSDIPTMTSNTSPSGVALASSEWSADYGAWRALDGARYSSNSRYWSAASGLTTGWICYKFTSAKYIRAYSITTLEAQEGITRAPKDWTFEASDDGLEWTVLDTQKGVSWAYGEAKFFSLANNTPYQYYRLNITSNNGGTELNIDNWSIQENPLLRTFSTTDQGLGAWPNNNEWDQCIVSFPKDKIQTGKTLDDVFHYSLSATLTQDTPALSSTNRVQRGLSGGVPKVFWGMGASNGTWSNVGFRPVFEYHE
ncbi:discoidin domain-containing protein (plasmid) [Paenibacillus rhizovicinus]|uniref:Discoidin domain-containing protein n=1 Tax=Paenibacillus rhizovicinus TaxID=2704463 RepID=A0A6C0PAT4_9BACL|nr:discoidin domain-containing protein [Paenibacillus rhizovicinus]QHW35647.1 discoidin domain-containing protein [Paenibacillus rhizovicinus]